MVFMVEWLFLYRELSSSATLDTVFFGAFFIWRVLSLMFAQEQKQNRSTKAYTNRNQPMPKLQNNGITMGSILRKKETSARALLPNYDNDQTAFTNIQKHL